MFVPAVPDYSPDFLFLIRRECLGYTGKKILIGSNVIIEEGHQVAPSFFYADVSLDRRASAMSYVANLEGKIIPHSSNRKLGLFFFDRRSIDYHYFVRKQPLRGEASEQVDCFRRAAIGWRDY
jgi:hypothetical protein